MRYAALESAGAADEIRSIETTPVHLAARWRGGVIAGGRKGAARRAHKTCGLPHLVVIKGRGGCARCLPGRFAQSRPYRRKRSKTRLSLQRRQRETTDAARARASRAATRCSRWRGAKSDKGAQEHRTSIANRLSPADRCAAFRPDGKLRATRRDRDRGCANRRGNDRQVD
jgi:hypothetical protein